MNTGSNENIEFIYDVKKLFDKLNKFEKLRVANALAKYKGIGKAGIYSLLNNLHPPTINLLVYNKMLDLLSKEYNSGKYDHEFVKKLYEEARLKTEEPKKTS